MVKNRGQFSKRIKELQKGNKKVNVEIVFNVEKNCRVVVSTRKMSTAVSVLIKCFMDRSYSENIKGEMFLDGQQIVGEVNCLSPT